MLIEAPEASRLRVLGSCNTAFVPVSGILDRRSGHLLPPAQAPRTGFRQNLTASLRSFSQQ